MAPPSEDVMDQRGAFYSSSAAAAANDTSPPQQLKEVADQGDPNVAVLLQLFVQHGHESATGSRGGRDLSAAKPVVMGMGVTGAGHKLEAVSSDPQQVKIAPDHVVPGIDLNLKPPESLVTNNTWSDVETAKPFERPMPGRVGRKDLGFVPFILESSEVAREYAHMQAAEAAAAANNNRRLRNINHAAPAVVGDAKRKRHHKYPAKTMAKLNEKIEALKKEALRSPGERRSVEVIQAEMDALEAKKDHIHAKVSGLLDELAQREQGSSSSGRAPPPPSGN